MSLTTKHQRLAALRPLSPESVASLAAAWDVRMVHESNAIHGNSLTLRETDIVISKGFCVSGKPLSDHIEAINLAKAWERVKEMAKSQSSLTADDLRFLHGVLMTRVQDEIAGCYRGYFTKISGTTHTPPKSVEIPELLSDLLIGIHNFEDPIERAAKLHHGIAHIHPFTDGNGRAARLAMNFVLLAAGYPPISIPTDLRQAYYHALEAADSGDFQTWLGFLTEQLDHELDEWLFALEPSSPEN